MKNPFTTGNPGEKSAVTIPTKDYEKIMGALEDLEDVRLYDEVKKNDSGERIPMKEAFKMIEAKRKKK
jgi:hypothetical protein